MEECFRRVETRLNLWLQIVDDCWNGHRDILCRGTEKVTKESEPPFKVHFRYSIILNSSQFTQETSKQTIRKASSKPVKTN